MTTACRRLDYTGATRQVLLEFANAANEEGLCWPSRARMMYNTGLSEKSVKQSYAQLRKDGVITHVGYAEYTDEEAMKVHDKAGRGRFPLYRVQPGKGVEKLPFDQWKEQQGKGAKKVEERGQNLPQETSVKEPSGSRRGAEAPPDVEKSTFGFYCHLANALDVIITPEDRQRTSGNFKDLKRLQSPTRSELRKVVSKMLEARTSGYDMSPQKALDKVRNGNVVRLKPTASAPQKTYKALN